MAYRERNLSGTSYVRLINAGVEVPIDGQPAVTFQEAEVLTFGAERIVRPAGNFSADLGGRANDQFNLINPNTGAVLGTARVRDVYIHLYSLHLYLAGLRDAGTLNPPPVAP
jgi:hypothetical protein